METDQPTLRSRTWFAAVVVLAVLALAVSTVGLQSPVSGWVALAVFAGITVVVIGWARVRAVSQRRHHEDELAAWAAERATQAERLRIARDLHDLASHGLGLITVRAAAALSVTGPDAVAERTDALADIERAGRQTTTELRRMLTVLRTPGPASLRPAETLHDLPAIVRDAGLTADLTVAELGEVSPGVQLTVCAVVREALNNSIRHAGATRASVAISRDGDAVVVEVRDAGPRPGWQPQPGAGQGLDGLRERVTALDGTLQAEPADGGYRLTARIPDRGQP